MSRDKPPTPVEVLTGAVEKQTAAMERQTEFISMLVENTRPKPPPPEPRIGSRSDFEPVGKYVPIAGLELMLAARVPIRKVPSGFFERRGELTLLGCRCRRAHSIFQGGLYGCKCGRVFIDTGRAVFSANTQSAREI